jgi:hypothetical protein
MNVYLGWNTGAVFDQFVQVVRCDPGLTSFQYYIDSQFDEIEFTPKQGTTLSGSRVVELISSSPDIVVYGAESTTTFPDGTLLSENYAGGIAFPGDPIQIYIDITNAAGVGYVVHDRGGRQIGFPLPVILFHELSHAKYMIDGHWPPLTTPPDQLTAIVEPPAIKEENDFRAQVDIPLRRPGDHWGGPGEAQEGDLPFPDCQPADSKWCFIATAAAGSPQAPEVQALRQMRDRYLAMSRWAALTASPMLDAYRQLSPGVVRDIAANPLLRRAVLLYAVHPVFHLMQILQQFSLLDGATSLPALVIEAVDAYRATLSENDDLPAALRQAADGAIHAVGELEVGTPETYRDLYECNWPTDLFPYLARSIRSVTSDLSGFHWAFSGIASFLTFAASSPRNEDATIAGYLRQLGEWLAQVPIPANAIDQADVRQELEILSEHVFTTPEMRVAFAEALLARYAHTDSDAVYATLADFGHVTLRQSALESEAQQ